MQLEVALWSIVVPDVVITERVPTRRKQPNFSDDDRSGSAGSNGRAVDPKTSGPVVLGDAQPGVWRIAQVPFSANDVNTTVGEEIERSSVEGGNRFPTAAVRPCESPHDGTHEASVAGHTGGHPTGSGRQGRLLETTVVEVSRKGDLLHRDERRRGEVGRSRNGRPHQQLLTTREFGGATGHPRISPVRRSRFHRGRRGGLEGAEAITLRHG